MDVYLLDQVWSILPALELLPLSRQDESNFIYMYMAAVPREFYDIENIPPHDSRPDMYKLPRDLAVSIIYMILKLFTFENK